MSISASQVRAASKLRLRIRELLEGRDLGDDLDVVVHDTQGVVLLLVYASVDGGPVESFEVWVRPVGL